MKAIFQKHKSMLFLLLLFILPNFFAVSRLFLLEGYADRIFLCYPEGGLPASAWERLEENAANEEEEQNEFFSQAALWKSLKEITVAAGQTGRERKVSCYLVKGQPEAVFGKDLLCGRYFTENEDHVCLLDQDTVRKLFGSEHVLGMEIRINGSWRRVIGVLGGSRQVCVIPAGEGIEHRGVSSGGAVSGAEAAGNGGDSFDGAAVRKKESGQSSGLTISRIEALFGSTGGQRIDGQLYYVTACLFYFGMLALILFLAGIGLGRKIHQKWIAAVCLAAAAVILWLGLKYAAPGSDYLPTYWSDFDFFSRIFQEKAEQIGRLAAYQEFSAWQDMFRAWQQVIGAGIMEGVLCIILFFSVGSGYCSRCLAPCCKASGQ